MDHDRETIFAPATPGGGAISVIRISGEDAHSVLDSVFSGSAKEHATLYHGYIVYEGKHVDEVMAVYFYAPKSYTGEDMAEIHCHGGSVTMSLVLRALKDAGARLAEPGEFTKRAFLAGKMDLSAAGAVMELIGASSAAGADAALRQLSGGLFDKITAIQGKLTDALAIIEAGIDYPEDDIEADIKRDALPLILAARDETGKLADTFESGRMLREGYTVVIAGRPNVGKSSLFNMLLGKDRAIVTHIPGTTRDAVDDVIIKDGMLIRLIDTAGIRESSDEVEHIGISRAKEAARKADITLFVLDASEGVTDEDKDIFAALGEDTVIVLNKSDLPDRTNTDDVIKTFGKHAVTVSALKGEGRDEILSLITPPAISEAEDVVITNERHFDILSAAKESLDSAIASFDFADLDCVTVDIRDSWNSLGAITGVTVTEEIINSIFDKFCLGK
jgi:tRNA modification GTPase